MTGPPKETWLGCHERRSLWSKRLKGKLVAEWIKAEIPSKQSGSVVSVSIQAIKRPNRLLKKHMKETRDYA